MPSLLGTGPGVHHSVSVSVIVLIELWISVHQQQAVGVVVTTSDEHYLTKMATVMNPHPVTDIRRSLLVAG